jgi:hypothetical protein
MKFDDDISLLAGVPDYITIEPLLKATPRTEGDRRFIFIEASNESKDQQNEVILASALEASAEYYKRFGNLDIDHYTQIGKPNPAKGWVGIPNPEQFEIGKPVDVRIEKGSTFVKGEIHSGTGPMAEKANAFWSSLMDVTPPHRWYPSVGGSVTGKEISIDQRTGARTAVINAVRWTNVAFSKTPVNARVAAASTVPFGPLAKSWGAHGFDLQKSLTAGYGTDSATLTGGAALRVQSLDKGRISYEHDFRDQFSDCIKRGEVAEMKLPAMVQLAQSRFGLSASEAAEYVERFLDDLQRRLKEKTR